MLPLLRDVSKLNRFLTRRQRLGAVCLLAVMLLVGFMQVTSVVSILPFLAVVANPGVVETNPWLYAVFTGLGFSSVQRFLVALGFLVLAMVVIANAVTAGGIWLRLKFAWGLNADLSKMLLARYLAQPYPFFLSRNSSEFSNTILSESYRFTSGFLLPLLEFFTKSITVLLLFLLVLVVNPLVASVATVIFAGVYSTVYLSLRRKMARIGKDRLEANAMRFKVVQETFGTIKETKILQREDHFVESYEKPTRKVSDLVVEEEVIAEMPRFALEILAFGGAVALVLYFLLTYGTMDRFLPVLGLYALAGYRIMPALQGVFVAVSRLRFNRAVVDLLLRDLEGGVAEEIEERKGVLLFASSIELRDVSFRYPKAPRPALDRVNLQIPFHSSAAFCGTTGAGKTTAVDIILGLLEPAEGALLVDGVAITPQNRRAWQRNIGYVPQTIYLSDSTIAENIAYGLRKEQIDYEAVRRAARVANIAGFIESELSASYDTVVGERGVRLSGGQRQRIGIARALYHNPDVLVLDEATSALDGATEEAVMEAVRNLSVAKTVILIAHRLSTIRNCDTIYLMEEGRIAAVGSYDDLAKTPLFRRLAAGGPREGSLSTSGCPL